ncbi:MAG: universal stress protein [Nitrospiraceae bacterium]|nr:universal stress protein [Nitrospiraceae bacterium]
MKILLATDGSEYSEGAARFLTRFAFSKKDEIRVLHVISEIPYEDDYSAQVRRVIKKVAPKILHACTEILKPLPVRIETAEEEGYPDTTIIEKAADYGADLIVMGARGVKGVQILFLGSATRAVTINSTIPVLVFKRPPWNESETMKIIFATDGSATAEAAGKFLPALPLPADTEVTVIHIAFPFVADIPEKYIKEIGEEITLKPSTFRESERIFEEARRDLGGFSKVDYLLRSGDPSREILAAERALEADLIVVGCRGLRGIKGMMGSVSRRILGNSQSSVLIGKPCAKQDISRPVSPSA